MSIFNEIYPLTSRETRLVQEIVEKTPQYAEEHVRAIRHWAQFGYEAVNPYLRGLTEYCDDPPASDKVPELHLKLKDIPPLIMQKPLRVWRGCALPSIPQEGEIFHDPGWAATSLRRWVAIDSTNRRQSVWAKEFRNTLKPVVLAISLPENTPLIPVWIPYHQDRNYPSQLFLNEMEILLQPGLKAQVTRVIERKGYSEVHLTSE